MSFQTQQSTLHINLPFNWLGQTNDGTNLSGASQPKVQALPVILLIWIFWFDYKSVRLFELFHLNTIDCAGLFPKNCVLINLKLNKLI